MLACANGLVGDRGAAPPLRRTLDTYIQLENTRSLRMPGADMADSADSACVVALHVQTQNSCSGGMRSLKDLAREGAAH
jgi:hypothetical protein